MKRIIALAAAAALAAALGACGGQAEKLYKDGTYAGSYDAMDSHGWSPRIEVTVKDGKVDAVNFDYVNKAGALKSQDAAYNATMLKVGGKTNPSMAYPELDAALVKAQKAPVDAVSGATSSSANFNALAAAVLAKAKAGDASPTVLPMDDTYTAFDKVDERGYTGAISVTYKDGKIASVKYDEYKADIKAAADIKPELVAKRTDEAYNKNMAAKTKVSWVDADAALEAAAVEKQGAADAVSGATGVSTRFNALLAQVIGMR